MESQTFSKTLQVLLLLMPKLSFLSEGKCIKITTAYSLQWRVNNHSNISNSNINSINNNKLNLTICRRHSRCWSRQHRLTSKTISAATATWSMWTRTGKHLRNTKISAKRCRRRRCVYVCASYNKGKLPSPVQLKVPTELNTFLLPR